MITRILIAKDGRAYYQRDGRDVSTHLGHVKADALASVQDGDTVLSNVNEKFTVLTPTWLDRYRKLERGPQLMTLKDLGVIAAETGMGPESVVADAGTGTGAAAIYFARMCKCVHSFDIEPRHLELGRRNAQALGADNITIHGQDIYEAIPTPDGQYDVLVLDNPEPWKALPHSEAVKIGGWIVAYVPSILQAAEFANAVHLHERLLYRKTVELLERHWAIKERRVRPSSDAIGHTGFLVFARRIK